MLEDLMMADEETFAMFGDEESNIPTVLEKPAPKPQVLSTPPQNTEARSQKPATPTKKPAVRSTKPATKPAAKPEKPAGKSSRIKILLLAAAAIILISAGIVYISYAPVPTENHSYAHISFDLPADWESSEKMEYVDRQFGRWHAPLKSGEVYNSTVAVEIFSYASHSREFRVYDSKGLEGLVSKRIQYLEDHDDCKISNNGSIEIDGTECRYIEYTKPLEIGRKQFDIREYELYIPVSNGKTVTLVDYSYYKKSKRGLKNVIESIRID